MVTATRKLWWCSGHRVLGHENKCANFHGHNYTLYAYAENKDNPNNLDNLGRVVDFSIIKEKLGDWINKNWDHTSIIYEKDKVLVENAFALQANKPIFIADFNPTAENMANYLLQQVCPMLFRNDCIFIRKIKLYETDNCFVEVEL